MGVIASSYLSAPLRFRGLLITTELIQIRPSRDRQITYRLTEPGFQDSQIVLA
jgi:hypothetical protein